MSCILISSKWNGISETGIFLKNNFLPIVRRMNWLLSGKMFGFLNWSLTITICWFDKIFQESSWFWNIFHHFSTSFVLLNWVWSEMPVIPRSSNIYILNFFIHHHNVVCRFSSNCKYIYINTYLHSSQWTDAPFLITNWNLVI